MTTDPSDEIRKQLLRTLQGEPDPKSLEKAASTLKLAAEAQHQHLESMNYRRTQRTEALRFWGPILTPLLTVVVLALTLIFQMLQYKSTVLTQQETAERADWKTAISEARTPKATTAITGGSALKTFLDSPKYGRQAREVTVLLLGETVNFWGFENLFAGIDRGTTWANLDDIVRLDRRLRSNYDDLDGIIKILPESSSAVGHLPPTPGDGIASPLSDRAQAEHQKGEVDREIGLVSATLGDFLVGKRGDRPSDFQLKLGDGALWDSDYRSADLHGADLRNAKFVNLDLRRANLRDMSVQGVILRSDRFQDSDWRGTAWWKASFVGGSEFLAYLATKFPFIDGQRYADEDVNKAEYQLDLKGLQDALKAETDAAAKAEQAPQPSAPSSPAH